MSGHISHMPPDKACLGYEVLGTFVLVLCATPDERRAQYARLRS